MTEMTLVLRLKADGTAEVVGAAKQVAAATAGIGAAGAEAGRVAKAATDEAALAQARLARLIEETRTPVERLKARLAELETLAPFVGTSEQAAALARATAELDRGIAAHTDQVRTAAAAQARLADLVDKTRSPVERLQATLAELEGLRPFATSAEELAALERAGQAAQAALRAHSTAAQDAAAAQARLAALIDETRTPVERLQARLADLATLKPFAGTEAETEALARAVASTEAALASYDATARATATAQARLAQVVEEGRSPVERLQQRLAELEALRPFARTTAEAQSLASAIRIAEAEIASHSDTVRQAAAAQGQLAQVVERTRTPVERLTAELKQLEGLRPFARTGEETVALERSLARTRAALAQASREQDGLAKSSGLAAHQITNLQYQLSDVVAQLGSGTSPFTIMMQQGPQVVDALGGITSATGLVTLGVLALGAVTVAPFAMLTARAMAADKHIRDVSVALEATGRASQATAADIEALTDRVAQSPFFNRAQAEQAIQGLARMRQISASLREQILSLAPALGAALGKDAATAALQLGDAFAHPAEGAKRLDDALDFLSAAQLESIERFDRQGNRAAAQQVIYDALLPRLRDLADKGLTPAARAAKELGDAWDGLAASFSRSEPIQEAVRVMTRLLNAMRDIVTWDTPVVRRLTFAQSRLQEDSATLSRWEKDGLTTGDRWQEGAFLKSDAAIIDAQRQKVAKLKAEVETLRQDYDQLQQTLRAPEASNPTTGGTSSAPASNEGQIKQGLADARELLQVEEQRKALQDKERLLQNAFNATKDAGERRQLGRAIMEVRAAYQALLTPQEQALKAASDEARLANVGRMERVRLAATIQAETEATNQRLVGKERENYITDKVNAAVRLASEGYTENVRVMDATARGALTLVDAYAAGEVAALRQAAANDANVQSLTTYGASVEELTQKYLEQRAAEAAVTFAGQTLQYQRQVEGLKAVTAAQHEGVAAVQDAQREQKVLEATTSLRAAAEASGNAEIVRSVNALIERYRALSKEEQEAQRDGALADMIRQQREGVALSKAELRLVGQTEEQRRLELARLRAINDLKAKGIDLEKETSAQRRAAAQTYVDEAVARERINIQLDREREAAAERVRVASKATDDVVEYFAQATDDMLVDARKGWRGLWDGVVGMARRTFATIIAEAALRPIVAPVIFSALGATMPASAASPQGMAALLAGGQGGGNQNGMGGGYGQYAQAGQSLYNAATGTNTLGTAATSFATSGMGYSLGLSSNAVAPGTGIAAGYVDTIGATQITNGMTLTSSGQAVTSTASTLGAAAPYGMLGGLAGAYIGTAAGGNKVVGGLSGAAIGVGSMYAGTAAMGAMGMGAAATAAGASGMAGATAALSAIPVYGWIAAAVLAAVMAIAGTQKASVGPNAAATLRVEGGQLVRVASHADNGGTTDRVNAVTDAAALAVNALTQFGVRVNEGQQFMYVEGGPKVVNNGRRNMTPEQYFREIIGSLSADGLVGRVLQSDAITKTGDLEKLVKGAALAKSVESSSTALDKLANTLQSVQQEAFKATAEALSPMVEEFKLASELGFGNEYLEVTNKQIESMLKGFSAEDIEKPQALQIAMAELTGKMAAFREQVLKVNPALAGLIDTIEEAAREKLVKDYRRDFDAGMNSAQGNGFLNQLADARTWWNNHWANSLEAGRNPNDMYAAQAQAILAGLDITQLGKAVEYFRDLDPVMAGLAAAARDIARQDALADFGMRELAARVRLGEVAQDDYDLRALEIEQRREAASVTDDVLRAELTRIHGLERAALVAERQAKAEAELTAQRERAVAAAGDVVADLDRKRASGSTGLTPQERIQAVDAALRRDLALSRSVDPAIAEQALRRLVSTRQTAEDTYGAVYGAGSVETVAMLRQYEDAVRDLAPVKSWEQKILDALVALPTDISANIDLRGRILELYEPAVLQRIDPAVREILERLATLAEQGFSFTALPADAQRHISEVLSRLQSGASVVALDFSRVPADVRRDLSEVLGRYASDLKVDEFEWSMLPPDARRLVAEVMGRYRNDVRVDQLDFSEVPPDTQRAIAELLSRTLNGEQVAAWTPITLPSNASRTVTETVKRDVSETVTSASMRELTAGYQAAQLQTTSMIIKQLDALGRIELTSGINIVRAITGVWGWGQEQLDGLARTAQPIVLSTQEAGYVARYADIADTWTKNPAWSPLQHYLQSGQFQGRTFAVGGRVDGPGTDTSDDVPAWLSRDEFVVRAMAARAAGYDVMEALNAGNLTEAAHMLTVRARNDNVPRFASGGRVGGAQVSAAKAPATIAAPTRWDGGAAAGVERLTGQVERLTAEVVRFRQERREDADRGLRLAAEIASDQIDAAERQEQQLRAISAKQRRVAI